MSYKIFSIYALALKEILEFLERACVHECKLLVMKVALPYFAMHESKVKQSILRIFFRRDEMSSDNKIHINTKDRTRELLSIQMKALDDLCFT